MPRLLLTDEHRSKLKPVMLESDIYDKSNLRTTLVGVLAVLAQHNSLVLGFFSLNESPESFLFLLMASLCRS
jgi:hypothetical protein